MKLLIYRDSYEAVREALASRPEVEPLVMEDDGRVVTHDGAVADDEPFEAAWFSRHLFLKPGAPMRDYARKVLTTPGVMWLQSGAAGYEHPTFQRVLEAGIRLTINDGSSVAIAEYVLAQVMASFHPGPERLAAQARHEWVRLPFRELRGTRWVILGYGSIGRHVAERARAFGAEIVGIRRTPRPDAHALRVVGVEALAGEIAAADVFVICAAANDGNARIVDAGLLARMKPDAVLVNVARGSLVDETALIAALDAGRPGMAVLDVFETEPLPEESPLWDHPKIRVTAHCSPDTEATGERGDAVFLEHLDAYLAGEPLRLEVKP
ncbi:MAG: D-2-hydroxyacid dehydrogenase [Pseudomonadales bacterium]|jgi:phosphoglycerate dehydrogenase-like enzyme|nr:D-2-hydroxyacid dehydrogenase [Pseudomonadales bacterium]